jgi:hypothetical protein
MKEYIVQNKDYGVMNQKTKKEALVSLAVNEADKSLKYVEEDFELIEYGEPPPPYKYSKYFPHANTAQSEQKEKQRGKCALKLHNNKSTNNCVSMRSNSECDDEADRDSHIYENIDELNASEINFNRENSSVEAKTSRNAQELEERPQLSNKTITQQRRSRFHALKKHSSAKNKPISNNKIASSNSGSINSTKAITDSTDSGSVENKDGRLNLVNLESKDKKLELVDKIIKLKATTSAPNGLAERAKKTYSNSSRSSSTCTSSSSSHANVNESLDKQKSSQPIFKDSHIRRNDELVNANNEQLF